MNIDDILNRVKKVHFIGIGGSGMAPLVEILHSKGYEISGSDQNPGDTLDRIKALGIKVIMGQKAENIEGAELIIYTDAILPDNPELVAAKASDIPTFERAYLFGAVTRKFGRCVGICGTHGKTTTTAMTVHTLIRAGLSPSALIGGKLPLTGTNGIVGDDDLFVCEACEFKNHYLELSPTCVVLLNIDDDHLEFFGSLDNLKKSFASFAGMGKTVIYNGDDANTVEALRDLKAEQMISFGLGENCEVRAENIEVRDGAYYAFDITDGGKKALHTELSLPGKHNIYNALASYCACIYCGAETEKLAAGLSEFGGAGRRFEVLYKDGTVTVCDDYAHHPTEVEATVQTAMKLKKGRFRLVFQPFTYSRTKQLFDDFVKVLSVPDELVLTEISAGREKDPGDIKSDDLAAKIPGCVRINDFDEAAQYLFDTIQPGDLIMTMGCGDPYKIAKKLVKKLKENA